MSAAAESRSLGLGRPMPGTTTLLPLLVSLLLLANAASASITHATCQITEQQDANGQQPRGFLPSLPLRTAPQIVTTALVTGILAAWQSAGSGQGGILRGLGRTLVQAFVPEVILFQLHHIGYAMYPKFDKDILPVRRETECERFRPTKAQIVAVYLGLLAVKDEAEDAGMNSVPVEKDPAALLRYVSQRGWKDVSFHHDLQPGYRRVTLQEAVFLPHLFYGLPKGRTTVFGSPVPQVAMVLLLIQALYYIIYVIARTSQGLYTTVIEWFFIPTSCTLVALGLAALLWEPAWRDTAHVNINLGPSLDEYPWNRSRTAKGYFAGVVSLVVPIGPVTTLVAYGTQLHDRPNPISQVLCAMGILWTVGFLVLTGTVVFGHYRPFARRRPWISEPTPYSGFGWYYSMLLVVARAITFGMAVFELVRLPAQAYQQMTWSQYIPHL